MIGGVSAVSLIDKTYGVRLTDEVGDGQAGEKADDLDIMNIEPDARSGLIRQTVKANLQFTLDSANRDTFELLSYLA